MNISIQFKERKLTTCIDARKLNSTKWLYRIETYLLWVYHSSSSVHRFLRQRYDMNREVESREKVRWFSLAMKKIVTLELK